VDPETKPSLWPLALLLGLLVSALSLFTSKRNQSGKSVHPQDSTGNKDGEAKKPAALTANIVPTPPNSGNADGGKHNTPLWEKLAVVAAFGLLLVNICQMRSTQKAAIAAETANVNAQKALTISEQAHVTIGRPDGVVADIVMSKDTAGIIVYFQNNGHLPAKFNWGNSSKIIAFLPEDPSAFTEEIIDKHFGKGKEFDTDNWWQPMWRAKNRKSGAISWSGTKMIGGNSLYAGTLWEIPRERTIQMQKWNRPFTVNGTFESCDSFHNYTCRNFTLFYRREPYNRFMLVSEDECLGFQKIILHPDPELDYMPACSTESEREETHVPKGLTPAQH
jgi:hypothetical protein